MSNQVTLGGDRLGAGNKQKINLHGYERSTHDLGYVWRSTMASGTLVPFMCEVGLPGDSFDINLDVDVKTHPTIGPLFGSYKVQLDVFQIPVRLYNGKLHMNMLNIGMKMQDIYLPQVEIHGKNKNINSQSQINPSSIFSYLGIKGLGTSTRDVDEYVERKFNAIPYLSYFDIYKNYYANKQEEIGAIVHNDQNTTEIGIDKFRINNTLGQELNLINDTPADFTLTIYGYGFLQFDSEEEVDLNQVFITISGVGPVPVTEIFQNTEEYIENGTRRVNLTGVNIAYAPTRNYTGYEFFGVMLPTDKPKVVTFPLENIDQMREDILTATGVNAPFNINYESITPYSLPLQIGNTEKYSAISNQEGLLLKTYQSDLFNNWVSTEWIDGENGINAITAVDTSDGNFTIDSLQLSRKVYDMLNRIAVSGGTYDDWLNAVYTHERTRSVENPVYMGGLIKELAFQEVISNAAAATESTEQPLGTLAGRGVLTNKHKGGKITIKSDEPCYIMGIVSITPRIDYSQGNKWDTNLQNMNDFHKPALDEIGFQDLITDQMDWRDTKISHTSGKPVFKSAGKQPAWINYMTNVNRCYGNFAIETEQMFMTLNRRYEYDQEVDGIKDLTTYIDPSKFNNIFADTRLDAQNFWTQIGVDITARRKMSAKLMPNL